ncbi:MAG: hypothetical protein HYU36_22255 [Planctomycetes bacterium]|nr:hypothetical protein [Planctomycetota bacterium]
MRARTYLSLLVLAAGLPLDLAAEPAPDELDERLGIEGTGADSKGLETPSGLPDETAEPALPDRGPYTVELVTWDDPKIPLDAVAVDRQFGRARTVAYWIPDIRLNGLLVTPPDSEFLEDVGLLLSLRCRRKTDLDDGVYEFKPGNASFEVKGDRIVPRTEAVVVNGETVKLRLVPVTFESTDVDRTRWFPFGMSLHADNVNLLERFKKAGPPIAGSSFYRLTLYLPAGQEYVSSWCKFHVTAAGTIEPGNVPPQVRYKDRTFHRIQEVQEIAEGRPARFEIDCGKVRVLGPVLWPSGSEAVLAFSAEAGDEIPAATLKPHAALGAAVPLRFEACPPPADLAAHFASSGRPISAFKTRIDVPWSGSAELAFHFQDSGNSRSVVVTPRESKLHLWTRQQRSAYLDTETIECRLVALGLAGAEAHLVLLEDGRPEWILARITLGAGPSQTRFIHIQPAGIHPGDYRLVARAASHESLPIPLSIRSSARKSNLLISNMTICMEGWEQPDLVAVARRQAAIGFDMLTWAGTGGSLRYETLGTMDPGLTSALVESGLPADLAYVPGNEEKFLEECVRQRIGFIDYVSWYKPWYNEGLTFHHTYPPDVDRWIRREQLLFGAAASFPSYWGVSYTWFPRLFGYVENGVDTDIHKNDRNRMLSEELDRKGFPQLSDEEGRFVEAHAASEDGEKRRRAEALAQRHIGRVRGYGEAFYEHFKLYAEGVREVRPDGIAVAFENAGHDCAAAGNYLPLFYGALSAATMEAYTDFGDWAFEAAFTTDWVRAAMKARPDRQRPFWLAAEPNAPPAIRYGYMLQAIGRRVEGTSYPFSASYPDSMDRTVGTIVSFLKAYGGVQPFVEVEPDVALLCSFSQMAFDGRTLFACHAAYTELARAQFVPQCIYEETIERGGLRGSGIRVLFIVRQAAPLPPKVLEEILAFQQAGGLVVVDAATKTPIPGARRLSFTVRHIWEPDMGGFEQAHRLALWKQYLGHREEIISMLRDRVRPFAQSEDERVITSTLTGGSVRFVFAVNDSFDPDKPEQQLHVFHRKRDVPLVFRDGRAAVYDLETLQPVGGEVTDRGLRIKLDLFDHPGLILAVLPEPIAAITTDAPQEVSLGDRFFARSRLIGRSGQPIAGPTPVHYRLRSPSGLERESLYRAAGVDDPAVFRLGLNDERGEWTLEVTDRVGGRQIRAVVRVSSPSAAPTLARPAGRVLVPREEATRRFLQDSEEKLVVLEENQQRLRPLAHRLADALNQSGRPARVLEVDPTCFDEILLRWYPTEREKRQMREVEEYRLVGARREMSTYVEPKTRRHVVALSGYASIPPDFLLARPAILFGGGRLAQSLDGVSPYRLSPHDPGPGNAVLNLVFSAFEARKHALAIVASDVTGFEAGIEEALALLASDRSSREQSPGPESRSDTAPLPYRLSPVANGYTGMPAAIDVAVPPTAPGSWRQPSETRVSIRHPISDLFKGFFASVTAVNRSGDFLVQPGHGQRRVLIGRGGKVLGAIDSPKGIFRISLSDDAQWLYLGLQGDARSDWMKSLDGKPVVAQCSPNGILRAVSILCPNPGNDYAFGQISDKTDFFVVAPDSQTLFTTREGGLTVGPLGGPYRLYNHSPHFRDFHETHSPDWPNGMALSADGKTLAMSCWAHPTANSMGGPLFMCAVSTEILALDTQALHPVWTIVPKNVTAWEQAPFHGCISVNPDASRVAYVDARHQLGVVDRSGKTIWTASWQTGKPDSNLRYPPQRIEMSDDGRTVLALYPDLDMAVVAREGSETRVVRPLPTGAGLAPDGRLIFSTRSGDLEFFSDSGELVGKKKLPRGEAALHSLGPHGFALAYGDGSVARWNWDAQPVFEIPAEQVAAPRAGPLLPGPDFRIVTALPTWPVPTLEILKKHASATLKAKGDPALPLAVPASPHTFNIHLAYRKSEDNPPFSVVLSDGRQREEFHLDLPAAHGRTQDIAWPGRKRPLRVECKAGPGVEISEFQVWEFAWPSKNLAYVRPAGAESEAGELNLGEETREGEEEAEEGAELDAEEDFSGQGLHGKMKDAQVRVRNTDPDQIAGPFLPAGDNPLKVLDGRLYRADQTLPWYNKVGQNDPFGLWFELDFGQEAQFDVLAVYSHTTRQSELIRSLGFMAFDGKKGPGGELHHDRPLALITDNDQFFRLAEVPHSRCRELRCYLGEVRKEYGLSEIEAYQTKRR